MKLLYVIEDEIVQLNEVADGIDVALYIIGGSIIAISHDEPSDFRRTQFLWKLDMLVHQFGLRWNLWAQYPIIYN